MKQLFINDKPLQIFFDNETNIKEIEDWVFIDCILYDDSIDNANIFDLNEQYSCKTSIDKDGDGNDTILICGDEDMVTLTVKPIIVTKLSII